MPAKCRFLAPTVQNGNISFSAGVKQDRDPEYIAQLHSESAQADVRKLPRSYRQLMTKTRSWIWYGLGACALGLAFLFIWQNVASHRELATQRNAFIEGEIEKLNRQVVEVKDVGEIVTVYDAMARAANEVQQRRTVYAAEALAELSRLPRQIVLASVTVEKNRLTLIGEAASESALERLKPTLEQGRFITKARIEESVPLADKRRFRLEAEIAGPSLSPSTPVEKQK